MATFRASVRTLALLRWNPTPHSCIRFARKRGERMRANDGIYRVKNSPHACNHKCVAQQKFASHARPDIRISKRVVRRRCDGTAAQCSRFDRVAKVAQTTILSRSSGGTTAYRIREGIDAGFQKFIEKFVYNCRKKEHRGRSRVCRA